MFLRRTTATSHRNPPPLGRLGGGGGSTSSRTATQLRVVRSTLLLGLLGFLVLRLGRTGEPPTAIIGFVVGDGGNGATDPAPATIATTTMTRGGAGAGERSSTVSDSTTTDARTDPLTSTTPAEATTGNEVPARKGVRFHPHRGGIRASGTEKDPSSPKEGTDAAKILRPPTMMMTRDHVEWLTSPMDFRPNEAYAASWYMNVETFRRVNTNAVGYQEAAVFKAFQATNKVRMTLDFMDLSVEHMSFWWKMVDAPRHDGSYRYAMNAYMAYINRSVHRRRPFPYRGMQDEGDTGGNNNNNNNSTKSHPLHPTVAVIAFTQNKGWSKPPEMAGRAHNFTITALGATLASLVQIGIGRIVVVGSDPTDASVVHDSFQLLAAGRAVPTDGDDNNNSVVTRVHDTDLTFALVSKDMVNSTFNRNNLPRGALVGLQRAVVGTDPHWTQRWLGNNATYWKYVYYTEADQLLQTRPSMLPHLRQQLDDGYLLNPHRLQPIGYEGDVPGRNRVPIDFKTPIALNSGEIVPPTHPPHPGGTASSSPRPIPYYQHCCASPDSEPNRPGRDDHPKCGVWWYLCGYLPGANHSRLDKYDFIKLSEGTGITFLAATEHARRCVPSTTPCRRGP